VVRVSIGPYMARCGTPHLLRASKQGGMVHVLNQSQPQVILIPQSQLWLRKYNTLRQLLSQVYFKDNMTFLFSMTSTSFSSYESES
jgi:hypothetical protein